jgi:hypothetical protein
MMLVFFQISGFHCFPYSVHYDPEHGHYVRAVRDIQPGEIILVSLRSLDHYLLNMFLKKTYLDKFRMNLRSSWSWSWEGAQRWCLNIVDSIFRRPFHVTNFYMTSKSHNFAQGFLIPYLSFYRVCQESWPS